jgi:hypothetical protein
LLDPQMRILSPRYIQENIMRLSEEEIQKIATDWANVGGADGGQVDAMGNAPMPGAEGGEGGVPGYSEVGGAGAGVGVAPNMQGQPPADQPQGGAPEAAPTNRFMQKSRESGLSQDILEQLIEGDIISNGKDKLLYEKGKFVKI